MCKLLNCRFLEQSIGNILKLWMSSYDAIMEEFKLHTQDSHLILIPKIAMVTDYKENTENTYFRITTRINFNMFS